MSLYRLNEGDMEVPDGWGDRSVTSLSFPAKSSKPEASFAITRDSSLVEGTSLRSYIDKQLVNMAKTCPRFELLNREEVEVDAIPAERVEFTWRSPDGSFVQQEQTVLLLPSGVAFTFTATAAKNRFPDHIATFRQLV